MTADQKNLLQQLVHIAQVVVRNATEQRMMYELARSIAQLDAVQIECYQFVHELECTTPTSDDQHTGD